MADPTREFAVAFVDELVHRGVRHAVLSPGSRSTPIALALAQRRDIALHIRIDERSAAFLALGIAKLSRDPVPVLCTSGTAAAHFLAAALEADQSAVPLLLLTADRPPELRDTGANQTIHQTGLYGEAVRWAVDVGVPEDRPDAERYCRSIVARAVATASGTGGRTAGPVHLNLPLREPLVPEASLGAEPPDASPNAEPATGKPFGWMAFRPLGERGGDLPIPLRARIAGARRGVVVAGDGAAGDGEDAQTLWEFAARAGWPLIAEPHSGVRWQGALRAAESLLADPKFTAAHRPDLVLVVGRVGLTRALVSWLARVPHVIVDPLGRWPDVTRSAEAVYSCSVADLRGHQPETEPGWADDWRRASEHAAAAIDKLLDESDVLSEPRVARDLPALLPERSNLVVASSMPIRDLDLVMRPAPVGILANRGVSGIDGFVSTVQGIALADPERMTVALTGDLSLLHDVNGLLPGPDPRPDVAYVVINNDGGGIFSLLPQGSAVPPETFERLFGTPHGIDIARLCAAYDCAHTLVATAAELQAAVQPGPGVRVVEVRSDRQANADLHRRLRAAAARAVAEVASA